MLILANINKDKCRNFRAVHFHSLLQHTKLTKEAFIGFIKKLRDMEDEMVFVPDIKCATIWRLAYKLPTGKSTTEEVDKLFKSFVMKNKLNNWEKIATAIAVVPLFTLGLFVVFDQDWNCPKFEENALTELEKRLNWYAARDEAWKEVPKKAFATSGPNSIKKLRVKFAARSAQIGIPSDFDKINITFSQSNRNSNGSIIDEENEDEDEEDDDNDDDLGDSDKLGGLAGFGVRSTNNNKNKNRNHLNHDQKVEVLMKEIRTGDFAKYPRQSYSAKYFEEFFEVFDDFEEYDDLDTSYNYHDDLGMMQPLGIYESVIDIFYGIIISFLYTDLHALMKQFRHALNSKIYGINKIINGVNSMLLQKVNEMVDDLPEAASSPTVIPKEITDCTRSAVKELGNGMNELAAYHTSKVMEYRNYGMQFIRMIMTVFGKLHIPAKFQAVMAAVNFNVDERKIKEVNKIAMGGLVKARYVDGNTGASKKLFIPQYAASDSMKNIRKADIVIYGREWLKEHEKERLSKALSAGTVMAFVSPCAVQWLRPINDEEKENDGQRKKKRRRPKFSDDKFKKDKKRQKIATNPTGGLLGNINGGASHSGLSVGGQNDAFSGVLDRFDLGAFKATIGAGGKSDSLFPDYDHNGNGSARAALGSSLTSIITRNSGSNLFRRDNIPPSFNLRGLSIDKLVVDKNNEGEMVAVASRILLATNRQSETVNLANKLINSAIACPNKTAVQQLESMLHLHWYNIY